MRIKQAGSFDSGGTPTLEAFTPRVSETWRASDKDERTYPEGTEPTSCYTYVTRTVAATRPLPDGTWERYTYTETVRVPFITPREQRKQRTRKLVERNTTRLDRSEAARQAPLDHDYNDQ